MELFPELTNCMACGVPLEGGRTMHLAGCPVRALIEFHFPQREKAPEPEMFAICCQACGLIMSFVAAIAKQCPQRTLLCGCCSTPFMLPAEKLPEPVPSITCPKCGKTSYNPHDIEERYCGYCHEFQAPVS